MGATSTAPGSLNLCLLFYLLAPRRPPGNISWTLTGSTVTIKWDPVVAQADESAVTGYKVQASMLSAFCYTKETTGNVNSNLLLPTDALQAGFPLCSHAVPGEQESDRHPSA